MKGIFSESRKHYQKLDTEKTGKKLNYVLARKFHNDAARVNGGQSNSSEPNDRRYKNQSSFVMIEKNVGEILEKNIEEQDVEISILCLPYEEAEERHRNYTKRPYLWMSTWKRLSRKLILFRSNENSTEMKFRELTAHASTEKKNFVAFSDEISQNLVQAVLELDRRELKICILWNYLEDCESAYRSFYCTNQDLMDQLMEAAQDRSRSRDADGRPYSSPLVDVLIEVWVREITESVRRARRIFGESYEIFAGPTWGERFPSKRMKLRIE